ncbi:MAG: DJ-1/PfpI family protein [Candidatus Colwellbacteria bacterium]|nr:DJ-1/PfpI family protein [Candidatus Colwellbacteria bacterium]
MDLLNKNKKKALIVVAHKDFRDEEYFITREILVSSGISVDTASFDISPAVGIRGGKVDVDVLISNARADDYDALVLIGGRGISSYLDHAALNELVRSFVVAEKLVAAICAAPIILARAGVLTGKKATVWHTPDNMAYPEILSASDAVFVDEEVVIDGRIITASYPEASNRFAESVVSMI